VPSSPWRCRRPSSPWKTRSGKGRRAREAWLRETERLVRRFISLSGVPLGVGCDKFWERRGQIMAPRPAERQDSYGLGWDASSELRRKF
jgi:hypothetical protein